MKKFVIIVIIILVVILAFCVFLDYTIYRSKIYDSEAHDYGYSSKDITHYAVVHSNNMYGRLSYKVLYEAGLYAREMRAKNAKNKEFFYKAKNAYKLMREGRYAEVEDYGMQIRYTIEFWNTFSDAQKEERIKYLKEFSYNKYYRGNYYVVALMKIGVIDCEIITKAYGTFSPRNFDIDVFDIDIFGDMIKNKDDKSLLNIHNTCGILPTPVEGEAYTLSVIKNVATPPPNIIKKDDIALAQAVSDYLMGVYYKDDKAKAFEYFYKVHSSRSSSYRLDYIQGNAYGCMYELSNKEEREIKDEVLGGSPSLKAGANGYYYDMDDWAYPIRRFGEKYVNMHANCEAEEKPLNKNGYDGEFYSDPEKVKKFMQENPGRM